MSRHRSAVVEAAGQLSRAASATLSPEFLESMRQEGIHQFVLDVFPAIHAGTELFHGCVEQVGLGFSPVSIADLLQVDVRIAVQFSARAATCVVADGPTFRRQMVVADATVQARIKTRWVHIWSESEKRVEWPCDSC